MKAIKASDAGIENDSGIICYFSLKEAILLKTILKTLNGDSETTLRKHTRAMISQLSQTGVWLNGPALIQGALTCYPDSLARLQQNEDNNGN